MERRPRVIMNGKEDPVKIVPWTSMTEWKEVCHQVFSSSLHDKLKGYETLRIWKARCPTTLPLSVECTFMFLGVEIEDKQNLASTNKLLFDDVETKLRYLYSMAITRFINLVTSEDPKKALAPTMVGMAQLKGISEWVVNLRHDVSHGVNMPALSTLRIAADEAYNWLHESYWRNEDAMTWDWVPGKNQTSEPCQLIELLDIWQSVHLYIKTNIIVDIQISDKYLRQKLSTMRSELISNERNGSKNWKLKHAVGHIEKMIFSLVKEDADAKELIKLMCDSKGFLPDYEALALHNLNTEKDEMLSSLPHSFMLQWQEFFCLLHWGEMLPQLIEELLNKCSCQFEEPFQRNIAALWINFIAKGLVKLHKIQNLLIKTGFKLKKGLKVAEFAEYKDNISNFTSNLFLDVLDEKSQADLSSNYPRLTGLLKLPSDVTPPSPSVILDIVKKALMSPTKWHKLFIASLLDVVGDLLPESNKQALITLMSLHLGEAKNNKQVYEQVTGLKTLSHLIQDAGLTDHVVQIRIISQTPDQGWTCSSTSGDAWHGRCIGLLPWQHKISPEDLILPYNWTPYTTSPELTDDSPQDMEITED